MKPVSATEAGRQAYASGRSFRGPERLVGLGFRHWLDGLRTSDIASWERAWNAYAGAMDLPAAKTAVGLLSRWVGLVAASARREIVTAPGSCPHFSHDEQVAIAMIAACQHHNCPALRACVLALLGSPKAEAVEMAEDFAQAMRDAGQVLSPAIARSTPLVLMPPATPWRL
jgi:hypothetical protein